MGETPINHQHHAESSPGETRGMIIPYQMCHHKERFSPKLENLHDLAY